MTTRSEKNRQTTGFIIHKQPFQNHGLILTVLEPRGQLTSFLLKQGQKKHLQLFTQYHLQILHKTGLSLITNIESYQLTFRLKQRALYCGLYVNELLGRLGKNLRDCSFIYDLYSQTLKQLSVTQDIGFEWVLRRFEFKFLEAVGFGLDWRMDINGEMINHDKVYRYLRKRGFKPVDNPHLENLMHLITGHEIACLENLKIEEVNLLAKAKMINRQRIDELLNAKPLVSRSLFV